MCLKMLYTFIDPLSFNEYFYHISFMDPLYGIAHATSVKATDLFSLRFIFLAIRMKLWKKAKPLFSKFSRRRLLYEAK